MGFEVVDIRQFEAGDFAPLLEAESQAWHDKLHWAFAATARVINACLREKRLSGYALVDEGRIRGYCFFFYDGEKGLIGDLFVHPDLTRGRHECRLLEHVIETLLGTPGLRRVEAQLPHFEREELEPCFLPRQFQSFLRRFMNLSLRNRTRSVAAGLEQPAPSPEAHWLATNIQLVSWERRFEEEAAQLLYEAYRQHVDAVINDQYASVAGATRLIENIAHHDGCGEFLPRVSRLALHRPSQRLAGILTVTNIREHTAHIPQVAVAAPFQGRGVGSALMEAAFHDLACEGFEEVTLTVTDRNAGAVRLYERMGFVTFQKFGAYIYTREDGL